MLHMVIVRHTAESCPGRDPEGPVHPCLRSLDTLMGERGIEVRGRWADPPAHVNYLLLDAPNAHVIQQLMMESGLFAHTTSETRAVLSMD